jgi:hypothetical protein
MMNRLEISLIRALWLHQLPSRPSYFACGASYTRWLKVKYLAQLSFIHRPWTAFLRDGAYVLFVYRSLTCFLLLFALFNHLFFSTFFFNLYGPLIVLLDNKVNLLRWDHLSLSRRPLFGLNNLLLNILLGHLVESVGPIRCWLDRRFRLILLNKRGLRRLKDWGGDLIERGLSRMRRREGADAEDMPQDLRVGADGSRADKARRSLLRKGARHGSFRYESVQARLLDYN